MTPEQFTKNLARMAVEVKKFIEDTGPNGAPTIVGKTATDFFAQNFDRQGFLNNGLRPWQDVRRRQHPRKSVRSEKARSLSYDGMPILVQSRNLQRSIAPETHKGSVIIFSDAHYAPYHNEGTDKLPKRQFIGDSAELDKLITSELERKLSKIIK
jgi:phage gpG-like protein